MKARTTANGIDACGTENVAYQQNAPGCSALNHTSAGRLPTVPSVDSSNSVIAKPSAGTHKYSHSEH